MGLNYNAVVNISADFTGQKAVDQAAKSLKSVQTSATELHGGLKELVTGGLEVLAEAFAIKEVFEFGKSIIELGAQLSELKEKTGISVEVLGELKIAAERVGIPIEGLQASLKKFSVAVTDAAHGGKAQVAAFESIGISAQGLKDKKPGDLLLEIADKFSNLQDGPAKAALAVKLFGKAGTELIPVLNEGRAGIEKFGIGMTDDFADRAKQFKDTLFGLEVQAKRFGVTAVNELLPTLQEIASSFNDSSGASNGSLKFVDYLGEGLRILALAAKEASNGIVVGFDTIDTVLEATGERIAYVLSGVIDHLSTIGSEAKAAATGNFNAIAKLDEEYKARQLERDKLYDADQEKRANDYNQRTLDRAKSLRDSEAKLTRNSLLLGDGTAEEILARQRAETAAKEKESRKGKIGNVSEESKKEREEIERFRVEQQKKIDQRYLEMDAVNMTTAEYKKLSVQKSLEADEAKKSVGFSKEGKAALHEVTQEIIEQEKALIDLQEQQRASFGQGAKEAFHDYLEAARDVASQTKKLFSTVFSGMEDAVVKFVQTGQLSFASLASAIEADLIRIAFRQAVLFGAENIVGSIFSGGAAAASGGFSQPSLGSQFGGSPGGFNLGASTQFANGGIMTSSGAVPLRKYANGGVADNPQLALFGEGSSPEAFVPLPDGRRIPVALQNGGAGSGTSVVVNVNVAANGDTSDSSTSSADKGSALGTLISTAVKSAIINEKRPGGLLA